MIQRTRKAIFKFNQSVIGVCDATNETIDSLTDVKCDLAIKLKTLPEQIDVEFEDEYRDFSSLSVCPDGKLIQMNSQYLNSEIKSIGWIDWVDEKTDRGINTILDYIKKGSIDSIIKFK
jgi:hypothetical protein